jgi:hypothetical protein
MNRIDECRYRYRHSRFMPRWFVYKVLWRMDIPPVRKNLATANRRLHRGDPNVPLLTEDGFVERWCDPRLTAEDVYRILLTSNANVCRVLRWECRCKDWDACDAGFTFCYPHRPCRGEDVKQSDCVWIDENFHGFYGSMLDNSPNRYRNIPRFMR